MLDWPALFPKKALHTTFPSLPHSVIPHILQYYYSTGISKQLVFTVILKDAVNVCVRLAQMLIAAGDCRVV